MQKLLQTINIMKKLKLIMFFLACILLWSCSNEKEELSKNEQTISSYDPTSDPVIAEFYAINEKYSVEPQVVNIDETRSIWSFIKKIFRVVRADCDGFYEGRRKAQNDNINWFFSGLSGVAYGASRSQAAWHGTNPETSQQEWFQERIIAYHIATNGSSFSSDSISETNAVNLQIATKYNTFREAGVKHNLSVKVLEQTELINESYLSELTPAENALLNDEEMQKFFYDLRSSAIAGKDPYKEVYSSRADFIFEAFLKALQNFESYTNSYPDINGLVIEYLNQIETSKSRFSSSDYDRLCSSVILAAYSAYHWKIIASK